MLAVWLQARRFFWRIDPGFFRFKLAIKTVLAILLSLWVTRDQPLMTQVIAGTASGFAMQGVTAKDFYWRVVQVFLLSLGYFSAFLIGLWARDSIVLISIVLIVMAFLVNYCRRFNLRYSTAPMMIWMLCFVATIMPFASRTEGLSHIDGLIKGLVVSATVLLLVWPENYRRLFRQNSQFYFSMLRDNYRICARWMATMMSQESELSVQQMREELNYLLESNRAMEHSQTINRTNQYMSNAVVQQHSLYQAFFLLTEALMNMNRKKDLIPRLVMPLLTDLMYQAARVFDGLSLNTQLALVGDIDKRISMNKLNQLLADLDITEPQVVMNIMNMKMAIQLINQHIQRWVILNEDA